MVQDPPECGEPHRTICPLLAKDWPQATPERSETVHFDYMHRRLGQVHST